MQLTQFCHGIIQNCLNKIYGNCTTSNVPKKGNYNTFEKQKIVTIRHFIVNLKIMFRQKMKHSCTCLCTNRLRAAITRHVDLILQ
jgi:hypothetical protein